MAKIAIVDVTVLAYEFNFSAIAELLVTEGHDVLAVYDGAGKPKNEKVKYVSCCWTGMDLSELEAFRPDYVLLFNGYHAHRHAASRLIEKKWKTYFMENAWLPQKGNLYVDHGGTGARGAIFRTVFSPVRDADYLKLREDSLKPLRDCYAQAPHGIDLPKDYILVPLQLEQDTSIVFDSPFFKDMPTFVHYVVRHFCDHPIVVKTHPKNQKPLNFPGVRLISENVPFNDLVPDAKLVVGINSTSLIEALIHYKPVAALGYNVASNRGAFVSEPEEMMFGVPREALFRQPNKECIDDTLYFLSQNQFPRAAPPRELSRLFK